MDFIAAKQFEKKLHDDDYRQNQFRDAEDHREQDHVKETDPSSSLGDVCLCIDTHLSTPLSWQG